MPDIHVASVAAVRRGNRSVSGSRSCLISPVPARVADAPGVGSAAGVEHAVRRLAAATTITVIARRRWGVGIADLRS
ncbi:hypothetical protein ELQ93_11125 [Labedella gwakjiensis]|uniref:Uncharacterized protein n=1 Tax=Labedella gwakjiensis TaxID=390269 RepID=A0ABY0CCJ4_9MICO|nr:hypothetical protein ELQ93_11125 [Labedella gwakjiensis]